MPENTPQTPPPPPDQNACQSTNSCGLGGCGMRFTPKRLALGAVLGAAAGFAYWYFVGCQSGSCPITSSPIISTLYGAGVGALLLGGGPRGSRTPSLS